MYLIGLSLIFLLAMSSCVLPAYSVNSARISETIIAPQVTQPQNTELQNNEAQNTELQSLEAQANSCSQNSSLASSISFQGVQRSFISHVPASLDANKRYPVIFAFHGRTNSNEQVKRYFALEKAMPDAIIIYPSALSDGNAFRWYKQDYELFDALLAQVKASYCIDESKIYTVGHSLGAYFANDLACARSNTIRAVASVAGGITETSCPQATAALLLHHPEDNLVSIQEGIKAKNTFLTNNPTNPAQPSNSSLAQSFNCQTHSSPTNPITWCAHPFATSYNGNHYPHQWPDETNKLILEFFTNLP